MAEIQALKGNERTNDRLIPDNERMRKQLKLIPMEDLLKKSGATFRNNKLVIDAFFKEFEIDQETFKIKNSREDPESIMVRSIILSYLTTSDATPASEQLISFRELPDGSNYCHAFEGYAPGRIARHFRQDAEKFSKACLKTGGIPVNIGDIAFNFNILPRIGITVVYFHGDETFNSSVSFLFDSNVCHYMVTAGLASIGAALTDIIINNS
ncbi:MAG: DUF3786 domain-containing protein [Desulfosporosinus sp.]|nr:DUF3786 domain-containing protein [Desulfosporosinus sp.]